MGRLKLPDLEAERPMRKQALVPEEESLAAGDTIEYGLTVEVSTGAGKAWVKFGTTSAVREGETTRLARKRITDFVNSEIDDRIEDLA